MFVLAFICLNAAGAACVAYCKTWETASQESEHCPLKKTADHCDKSAEASPDSDSVTLKADEFECCPMTISIVAAPIEKRVDTITPALAVAAVLPATFRPKENPLRYFTHSFDYRGPPPLDRRVDRIKHRVLLI